MGAYELADPVDIFKTYNEAWFDAIPGMAKWNERKAKLDEFTEKAKKAVKIANSNIGWFGGVVKKLFMDSNNSVHKGVLNVMTALARGMRKNFSSHAKKEAGGLLLRYKDSKLVADVNTTLDAFTEFCMKPSDVVEDIKSNLTEKHIGMKISILDWVLRSVKDDQDEAARLADKLLGQIIEMTDEGDKGIRDAASKFIAMVIHLCGDEKYSKQINKIQASKMTAIQKFIGEYEKGGEEAKAPVKAAKSSGANNTKPGASVAASAVEEQPTKKSIMKKKTIVEDDDNARSVFKVLFEDDACSQRRGR